MIDEEIKQNAIDTLMEMNRVIENTPLYCGDELDRLRVLVKGFIVRFNAGTHSTFGQLMGRIYVLEKEVAMLRGKS